jgi:hypothetical protein
LPASREVVAGWMRFQAHACRELGSFFYGSLLESAASDLEVGGVVARVLTGFEGESGWSALALRLMGAVHRLVLTGRVPELAAHFPSVGGDGDADAAWPFFHRALSEHLDEVRSLVARPCQTNEVGRCAALLGGFLEVAVRTSLPLRILELGASAGLNLRWDHYRYEAGDQAWGDPASRVRFTSSFEVPPRLARGARVEERRGCDLNPIDPATDEGSLTLRSFIWADQLERFQLLEAAIDVARRVPAVVDRADAADFLEHQLAEPRRDVATVVFHSVFIQYLDEHARARLTTTIEAAQERATAGAPVAYLRMEPGAESFEVRLDDVLLGTTRPHGTGVRWLGPTPE